jgi:DNA-binding NarL/FixJ family response regulator
METRKYRIVLADDHEVMLDGLKSLLENEPEFQVVGSVQNGKELVKIVPELRPDICLVDLDMPEMNGLQASAKLLDLDPEIKIILLTMHNEGSILRKVKEIGMKGYIPKSSDSHELIFAIHQVLKGKTFYSGQITSKSDDPEAESSAMAKISQLTKRELEIIDLLCKGYSNKQMASLLFISSSTVDNHRTSIMRKLDVHNVVELTRFCLQHKLA